MDRIEAEILYDSGKEPTVERLIEYHTENIQLKEKIASLEKNSQNSSKPPSTDGFKGGKDKDKKVNKGKRKAGGQPGHKGSNRDMLPLEEVDHIVDIYPEKCQSCNEALPQVGTGKVHRKQVTEIPPIEPEVTEYRCHSVECSCGHITKADMPDEIAKSDFGPRLAAIIAYLTAVHHISRRGAVDVCSILLGVNICLGSVQTLLEEMSSALEPVDKELQSTLPNEPVINADETGWRDRWLWVFVTSAFIYFRVGTSRGYTTLVDVLGATYDGILCVDRWGAYTKYHKGLMQICWAHLKRDFQWVLDVGLDNFSVDKIVFAKRMKKLMGRLMALWHKFKRGEISRDELKCKSKRLRSEIINHLKRYENSEDKVVRSLCRKLLKRQDHLFTFIFHEGVEPTNNVSERSLRGAVQWRKICFGNRSDEGAILTGRILTAAVTFRLQDRNPLEFLVRTIIALRTSTNAPSLL